MHISLLPAISSPDFCNFAVGQDALAGHATGMHNITVNITQNTSPNGWQVTSCMAATQMINAIVRGK